MGIIIIRVFLCTSILIKIIYFRLPNMEDFQEEIVKLLDVITVILAKLDEIGDNVASEIKVILDKSRNEVAVIQNSIIGKLKQEDPFKLQEQDNGFHDAQNVSTCKF